VDSVEGIQLAFAAGATRVVLTTAIADRAADLRACLSVAGDWLAVGLDPRPERLSSFPWRRPAPPTIDELVGELVGAGVHRLVLTHGGTTPDLPQVDSLVRSYDAEILVAGGVRDLDGLRRLRDTGVGGVILGEAILSGAIELPAALEAAA
jgi:phosphoribosylformimino-5-aminoimidazole carboxamide ribotide isomerase